MAVDPMTVIKGVSAAAQLVSGLGGLFGRRSRRASEAETMQMENARLRNDMAKRLAEQALAFDPVQAADKQTEYARESTAKTLRDELISLNTDFRNAGGSPMGDTLFNVRGADITRRRADILKQISAEAIAQNEIRKVNMLNQAILATGSVDQGLEAIRASGQQASASGAQMLSTGIDNALALFETLNQKPSSSGSGKPRPRKSGAGATRARKSGGRSTGGAGTARSVVGVDVTAP